MEEDLCVRLDDKVQSGEASKRQGEKFPSFQLPWKSLGVVSLQVVNQLHKYEDAGEEGDDDVEQAGVEEGEADQEEREENDGGEKVENREPLVMDDLGKRAISDYHLLQ